MNVHQARQRLGEELAREHPVEADVVIPVPDSSMPAAIGYAAVSGITYNEGFVKNRDIGRTFIEPTDELRQARCGPQVRQHARGEHPGQGESGDRDRRLDRSWHYLGSVDHFELARDAGATEVHIARSPAAHRPPVLLRVDDRARTKNSSPTSSVFHRICRPRPRHRCRQPRLLVESSA
ncbi:MAG: hypothetical protein R2710_16200 [Acidimicrobiales bacterium]